MITPLRRIMRFGVIGVMNTAIDFGILNLLLATTGRTDLAIVFNTISFSVAVTNSYFWNKYWTFEERGRGTTAQFFEFLVVSIAALIINDTVLYLLVRYVKITTVDPRVVINGAKLVATLASMTWNFLGYRFVVFKEKSRI